MVMSLHWDDHAGNAIRTTARYKCLQPIAYFQPHTQPHTRAHICGSRKYLTEGSSSGSGSRVQGRFVGVGAMPLLLMARISQLRWFG